jgi:hypothetical protein
VHLWCQAQGLRVAVRTVKGRWPSVATLPKEDPVRGLIGKLWVKKLEAMNLDLSKLGFGWWLLLLSAAAGFGQVAAMLEEVKELEAKETAAAAN